MLDVILYNIRSTHNVGSIMRSSDAFKVAHIYLTGYTPYPHIKEDSRLPHIYQKLTRQIAKTALGAEEYLNFSYHQDIKELILELKSKNYIILALEQAKDSVMLKDFIPDGTKKYALILGEEVKGITKDILDLCDCKLEIPMFGKKESLNVSVATGIALYELNQKLS